MTHHTIPQSESAASGSPAQMSAHPLSGSLRGLVTRLPPSLPRPSPSGIPAAKMAGNTGPGRPAPLRLSPA